jgi:hypothetical protein
MSRINVQKNLDYRDVTRDVCWPMSSRNNIRTVHTQQPFIERLSEGISQNTRRRPRRLRVRSIRPETGCLSTLDLVDEVMRSALFVYKQPNIKPTKQTDRRLPRHRPRLHHVQLLVCLRDKRAELVLGFVASSAAPLVWIADVRFLQEATGVHLTSSDIRHQSNG